MACLPMSFNTRHRLQYRRPVIMQPGLSMLSMPTLAAQEVTLLKEKGHFRLHARLGRTFYTGRDVCSEFIDKKGHFFHVFATKGTNMEMAMKRMAPGGACCHRFVARSLPFCRVSVVCCAQVTRIGFTMCDL